MLRMNSLYFSDPVLERCLEAFMGAHAASQRAISRGLNRESSLLSEDVRFMVDCSDICWVCSGFVLRNSTLPADFARACAELCEKCADICSDLGEDSEVKSYEAAFRECAAACQAFVGENFHTARLSTVDNDLGESLMSDNSTPH